MHFVFFHKWMIVSSFLALSAISFPSPVISKIADVPRVDEKVDFVGSRVMDHRVKHYQMLWIVIDREPKGQNCR